MSKPLRVFFVVVAMAGGPSTSTSQAEEGLDEAAPLVRAMSDPLALGRLVERRGDAHVLDRLDEATPVEVRLAAVIACPWLRAPEEALETLAELAAGRDPHLAPAAVDSAHAIVRDLDRTALARREVALASLAPARDQLARLAGETTARADVRYMAGFTADALTHLMASPGGDVEEP